jgi:Chaperone of endosialidase
MKTKIQSLFIVLTCLVGVHQILAQGTAFTYQGRLQNNGAPANGTYDLTFSLFNVSSGGSALAGPQNANAIVVSNGLFTVTLDFGNQFSGANRWLEIGVQTNGGGSFSTLAPRQPITPAPYAITAETAETVSTLSGLNVQGNRAGGTFNSSVGFFENTSTATGSAGSGPALRVVCDGGSAPAGALSVSDNGSGPIAEFGNGLEFVASIANDGTITNLGDIDTAGNITSAQTIHGNAIFASDLIGTPQISCDTAIVEGTVTCQTLNETSDRNAKENFASLDAQTILEKVAALPLTEWNYKTDSKGVQHIGPMAQDFHAAFDLNGADDKHISVVDEGGVALAAIQGLNQKLEQQDKDKDTEIQELKQRLEALEKIVLNQKSN